MPSTNFDVLNKPISISIGVNSFEQSSQLKRLESKAKQALESHPHFRGRSHQISCCCKNGRVVLQGAVPSFYLKQLAQEVLHKIGQFESVENRIVVASPNRPLKEEVPVSSRSNPR